MANYCYNYIIFNSDDVQKINRIVEFFNSYNKFETTTEWGDSVINGDYEIDYRIFNPSNKYGARWFDFDVIRDSDQELRINGDSAWTPMQTLVGGLCYTFDVKGWIEYSESGCDFGGRTSFDNHGVINEIIRMTYSEWGYHCGGSDWINYELKWQIGSYDKFEDFISKHEFITNKDDVEFLKKSFNELKANEPKLDEL